MSSRRRADPAASRRRGLTLLEITLALTLFAIASSAAVLLAGGTVEGPSGTLHTTDLEARVRRALDRVALELVVSTPHELDRTPVSRHGISDLVYRPSATALEGSEPRFGDYRRVVLELDPAEIDDGADNDGDGLIDEGRLYLVRDDGGADETRVILASGVAEFFEGETPNGLDDNGNGLIDERGFHAQPDSDRVRVRLCLQQRVAGQTIARSLETTVRLRR